MSLTASDLACICGERLLFRRLALAIEPGEALRVTGANGSGKTSLLRILSGLSSPAAGAVSWEGRPISAQREHYGSRMIYLGHASGVKDDLCAWENLVVGSTLAGSAVSRNEACEALARLGLARAAHLPVRVLSQGQRKRVALARLQLSVQHKLWILDEPFTALDAGAVAHLCGIIDVHLAGGGMLVYTTHQSVELRAQRTRELELSGGAP